MPFFGPTSRIVKPCGCRWISCGLSRFSRRAARSPARRRRCALRAAADADDIRAGQRVVCRPQVRRSALKLEEQVRGAAPGPGAAGRGSENLSAVADPRERTLLPTNLPFARPVNASGLATRIGLARPPRSRSVPCSAGHGSGAGRRWRRASRRWRWSSRAGRPPGRCRAAWRKRLAVSVAHAGHMRLEKRREESRRGAPVCRPKTPASSTGRGDSWSLGKPRACPAASLPRRRSPVRIWCSAPNRPEPRILSEVRAFSFPLRLKAKAVCSCAPATRRT
jgi:hypothetical protein